MKTWIPACVAAATLSILGGPEAVRGQSGPAADDAPPAASRAPVLVAEPAVGSLRMDGRLDEPAWATARLFTDLVQRDPDEGAPVSEPTEVRILVGEDALYVGARLLDSEPGAIRSQLARRDNAGASDFFQVNLDTNHDHLTAYLFRVTPSGPVMDAFADGPENIDMSWDPVWESFTAVDDEGWTAEMRIPFSQLRYDGGNDTWGLQLIRGIHRKFEFAFFSLIPRTETSGVDRYGHLVGMSSVEERQRIELLPYALAKAEELNFADGDPFHASVEPSAAVGLDAKVGLTGELTLDLTLNPDFGQVELDPAVVNLTAFETFFPERRPFFVEGADAFRFGDTGAGLTGLSQNLFYSRRIGRQPARRLSPATARFVDAPEQTTILGAAKVSGRMAGAWKVGMLNAVTAEEVARFVDPSGDRGRMTVEPLANYFAGRARRELDAGNSTVGVLGTSVVRDLDGSGLSGLLHSQAATLGADFTHTWDRRMWFANGYVAGSRVAGSTEAIAATQSSSARYFQRPDAGHVELDPTRTSLTGYSAALGVGRTGGRHWLGSVVGRLKSPGWEVNDLGFDTRSDTRGASGVLTYRETTPGDVFRNYRVDLTGESFWNFAGDRTGTQFALGGIAQLSNFYQASVRVFHDFESVDDHLTRGGPLAVSPAAWTTAASLGTDPRRSWQGNASVSRRWSGEGAEQWHASAMVSLRPAPSVQISLQPMVMLRTDPAQYLGAIPDPGYAATFGRRYLFGGLEQTTTSLTARVDWTFTPSLSLQLFAQPLLASGRFTDFKELAEPRRWAYRAYGAEAGTLTDTPDGVVLDPDGPGAGPEPFTLTPDFNLRTLRGNAVLRWEYRPGSTLFFVWQQRRFDRIADGVMDVGRDLGALFATDAENVFVVKATFWLGG